MLFNFTRKILEDLHVSFTDSSLRQYFNEQFVEPSLYGISIILDQYNVPYECKRFIHKDKAIKSGFLYVAIINSELVMFKIDQNKIWQYSWNKSCSTLSLNDFINRWNGVAIEIELSSLKKSGEPDYKEHRIDSYINAIRYAVVILGPIIALLYCAIKNWDKITDFPILLIVNVIGIYITVLLLLKELNIQNKVAKKLCGLIKEGNCENVTHSKAANFLGFAKLSEIGFGYFFTNFIVFVCYPEWIHLCAYIGACVLPFSFWSIWFQKYKAKSWCMLCLLSISCMWLLFATYIIYGFYDSFHLNVLELSTLIFIYVFTTFTTHLVVSLYKKITDLKRYRHNYNILKSRPKVINALLKQDEDSSASNDEPGLVFGNPYAERKITIFSNPYCSPCAMLHGEIENLPNQNVCLKYDMTYFSNEYSIINKYIIAAYYQLGADRTWELLCKWYNGNQHQGEDFFKGYNLDIDDPRVITEFDKQNEWRKTKNFRGTPTILVNGLELVEPYEFNDYIYMPT